MRLTTTRPRLSRPVAAAATTAPASNRVIAIASRNFRRLCRKNRGATRIPNARTGKTPPTGMVANPRAGAPGPRMNAANRAMANTTQPKRPSQDRDGKRSRARPTRLPRYRRIRRPTSAPVIRSREQPSRRSTARRLKARGRRQLATQRFRRSAPVPRRRRAPGPRSQTHHPGTSRRGQSPAPPSPTSALGTRRVPARFPRFPPRRRNPRASQPAPLPRFPSGIRKSGIQRRKRLSPARRLNQHRIPPRRERPAGAAGRSGSTRRPHPECHAASLKQIYTSRSAGKPLSRCGERGRLVRPSAAACAARGVWRSSALSAPSTGRRPGRSGLPYPAGYRPRNRRP